MSSAHAEAVKAAAAALGFDACGIAEAGCVDPEDRLGEWLARGHHAGMEWMARTKEVRQDARLKLPGARSVVVVARNYYADRPEAEPGAGRVSRYAWGRDYHRVMAGPMKRLAGAISSMEAGTQCYGCVDTGPVLERAWAAQAGVGWIGKNGMALRDGLGSWFFLGVIVTTLQLEPDSPARDRCGTCTRCIDACPTGAIVAPRVVDSRRCISYHTIENRGEIPESLHPQFGAWVFGCDVCQEVCPWNRDVTATTERDFLPRPAHANPELETWASMSAEDFAQMFAGSSIRRATLEGMRRNAAIARANLGNKPASRSRT